MSASLRPLFIWAHRGASAEAPENTLAAFRLAEEAGADGIEMDVHLTRDGHPVIIHDDTVDRTTDGRGRVQWLSLRQVRRLDAGSWFAPEFAGEKVPILEEVLAWAKGRLRLNLEIKASAAGRAVLERLRDFPDCQVVISSFDHSLLEELRRKAAELPLAFLIDSRHWRRGLKRASACAAESINPRFSLVSQPLVASSHRLGLAVYPWTVDDGQVLRRLRRAGIDGIFSNCPAQARQALHHPSGRRRLVQPDRTFRGGPAPC